MKPIIKTLPEIKLVGMHVTMSYAQNKVGELWKTFMPQKHTIQNAIGAELYSLEVFPEDYFNSFSPMKSFEKWAAVAVSNFDHVPEGMDSLIVPEGLYASFQYKGSSKDAGPFYQNIHARWLPENGLKVDHRPHLAIMGEKYKNDHPDSEEEILVPVIQ